VEKLCDKAFIVATRKMKLLGGSTEQSELSSCVFGHQNKILSDILVEGLDKAVSEIAAVICNSGMKQGGLLSNLLMQSGDLKSSHCC
jgi:hypothetical protein